MNINPRNLDIIYLIGGSEMALKSTVLVVDDESDLLEVLGQELSDNGYEVTLAHGGGEGP